MCTHLVNKANILAVTNKTSCTTLPTPDSKRLCTAKRTDKRKNGIENNFLCFSKLKIRSPLTEKKPRFQENKNFLTQSKNNPKPSYAHKATRCLWKGILNISHCFNWSHLYKRGKTGLGLHRHAFHRTPWRRGPDGFGRPSNVHCIFLGGQRHHSRTRCASKKRVTHHSKNSTLKYEDNATFFIADWTFSALLTQKTKNGRRCSPFLKKRYFSRDLEVEKAKICVCVSFAVFVQPQ